MKKLLQDLIFDCKKCGHHLYITDGMTKSGAYIRNVLKKTDCPNCGEEAYELWIFTRNGNFEREQ